MKNKQTLQFASYITRVCALKNYFINITKLRNIMFCIDSYIFYKYRIHIIDEKPFLDDGGIAYKTIKNLVMYDRIDYLIKYSSWIPEQKFIYEIDFLIKELTELCAGDLNNFVIRQLNNV